jgi:hypothetical protein
MEAEMAVTTSTIYPYPNGYSCAYCGAWVGYGTAHYCSARQPIVYPLTWQEATVSDYEMKQLAEIVEALEKARTAFDGLASDDDKGRGNRAAAYLSARFGVKEATVIDLLLEES